MKQNMSFKFQFLIKRLKHFQLTGAPIDPYWASSVAAVTRLVAAISATGILSRFDTLMVQSFLVIFTHLLNSPFGLCYKTNLQIPLRRNG